MAEIKDVPFIKTDQFIESSKKNLEVVGNILAYDDSAQVVNAQAGEITVEKGNVGKSGNGLQHIIEQRFEKDDRSVDEISAMLSLVVTSAAEGKISRDVKILQNQKDIGTLDIEKNGIIAFVAKSRDGTDEKFVITGFDDSKNKKQAEDAVRTVIAEHSYAPEFAIVKEQVVATLVSAYSLHQKELENNKNWLENSKSENERKQVSKRIEKLEDVIGKYNQSDELKNHIKTADQIIHADSEISRVPHNQSIGKLTEENTSLKKQIAEQDKLLHGEITVEVNGKPRTCAHGLSEGFMNAVKLVDEILEKNHQLADENDRLQKQNQARNKSKGMER